MSAEQTPTEFISTPAYQNKTFGQLVRNVVDQTKITPTLNQGNYTPSKPFPSDYVNAQKEFYKNIQRNVQPGKFGQFIGFQTGFYATNPAGANVINPVIVSGMLPGEGIIPTTILSETTARRDLKEPKGTSKSERTISARAGGNLGQEEGPAFSQRGASIGDFITNATQALAGALGIKQNNNQLVPLSPSQATLEERLTENRLNPDNSGTVKDAYNAVYDASTKQAQWFGRRVSGVKIDTIEQYFKPIDSGDTAGNGKLIDDAMLRDDLDRGFESNAPFDSTTKTYGPGGLEIDVSPDQNASFQNEAPNFDPPVEKGGMIFPFYFESLNFFPQHPEKFISFQATFNGIQENYVPTWSPQTFFGRSTPVYTYQQTERGLQFSFVIWASNRAALNVVKQRVNWLARHCYPSYVPLRNTSSRILFEAPIVSITLGDLFKRLPVIIRNLSYDWDLGGNNRWELTKDMIMPQACNVSIDLIVLNNRFMQNAGIATESSNGKESSDFYSYIRPKNRKITEPVDFSVAYKSLNLNDKGDAFAAVTLQEADEIITAKGEGQ